MPLPEEESSFCTSDSSQGTLSRELLCIVRGSWHLPPSAWEMLVVNHTYQTGTCACFTAAESEVLREKYPTSSWTGSRGQIFPEQFSWKEIFDQILIMGFSWDGHKDTPVVCTWTLLSKGLAWDHMENVWESRELGQKSQVWEKILTIGPSFWFSSSEPCTAATWKEGMSPASFFLLD